MVNSLYQRLVFGVYRQNQQVSFEVFYAAEGQLEYDYMGIKNIESVVVILLNNNETTDTPALFATKFPHHDVMNLSSYDVADAGWRIINANIVQANTMAIVTNNSNP